MKRIIGNIGSLALPNGKYAFGRVLRSSNLEFYNYFGNDISDLPVDYNVLFTVCAHVSVFSSMRLVGKRAFLSEDETWPPPKYIYDVIGKTYDLYVRGKIIQSTYEECKGLERASVWELHHIVDRIMETHLYPSLVLDHDLSKD